MFPIPWNFPLRKKNGNLVNIGDAIDAGTEIPEHTSSDEGKLLSVDENGDLEWSDTVNSEIQTLTNEVDTIVNDFSVKNLLVNKTVPGTKDTGLTVVVNENKEVIINGTSTTYTIIEVNTDVVLEEGKNYILSGCPSGGSGDTYKLDISISGSFATDYGEEAEFTYSAVQGGNICRIVVYAGTYSNLTFKPMIRPASIKNSDYVPYAMTNRELTDRIVVHEDTITFNENGKYIFSGGKEIISARVRSSGNYVVVIGNNGSNSAFILYNHEGTNWTRITTQPQLTVKWVEVIA